MGFVSEVSAAKDDGFAVSFFTKFTGEIEATHVGHGDVGQDEVEVFLNGDLVGFQAIFSGFDFPFFGLEGDGESAPDGDLVIDDEDLYGLRSSQGGLFRLSHREGGVLARGVPGRVLKIVCCSERVAGDDVCWHRGIYRFFAMRRG